ncbi:MAG: hypothetical protein AB1792_07245 [Candidatus Zixiibacteriota bacterium]
MFVLVLLLLAQFAAGISNAWGQVWNGSMRLDYQNIPPRENSDERIGTLTEQYYLRYSGRLFYKNDLLFSTDLAYRTASAGQPVDVRPRYEWLLSGYGYGWRLSYEPYTLRLGSDSGRNRVRRWRSSIFVQPARWPRLTYDFLRGTESKSAEGIARDRWHSYSLTWAPVGVALAAGYSRQIRTARDTTAQMLEVYRLSLSAERTLLGRHRLNVGYSYDRNWDHRPNLGSGEQDQHVPNASLTGQPTPWMNWAFQYSRRFLHRRTSATGEDIRTNDRLASGAMNLNPWKPLTVVLSRYIEDTEERRDQPARRTDYWQGRVSTEGRFYRQIRILATVYRLYYVGAPTATRYNDAYFLALRGRPHRHAEWSTEMSLADRHGAQTDRYSANLNVYSRLYPTAKVQCQLGYTTLATATAWDRFHGADENLTGNLQYTPDQNLSLTGGVTRTRNRRVSRAWDNGWTLTGTYRWPSFGNLGINYSRRIAVPVTEGATGTSTRRATRTLLVDLLVWLGPRTTATAGYTYRSGGGADPGSIWGVGLSTQF